MTSHSVDDKEKWKLLFNERITVEYYINLLHEDDHCVV